MSKTSSIFNNPQPKKVVKKAYKSKKKFMKSYGDDTNKDYKIAFKEIPTLDFIGASNIVFGKENQSFDKKALIVGNIRMGFGHYRISIAMASAARALGYKPYWLDLASFDATGSKMIRKQNDMYSLASRISQKSKLFNKIVWEPLNSEGFKKISYNAKDQANSELLVPIFRNIPKDIPYIATHVWPSQGAIHAGMTHVVNAIPDDEYDLLLSWLQTMKKQYVKYRRSIASLLQTFIQDMPRNAETAAEIMKNFDMNKYKQVINFAEAANGGRAIPISD